MQSDNVSIHIIHHVHHTFCICLTILSVFCISYDDVFVDERSFLTPSGAKFSQKLNQMGSYKLLFDSNKITYTKIKQSIIFISDEHCTSAN